MVSNPTGEQFQVALRRGGGHIQVNFDASAAWADCGQARIRNVDTIYVNGAWFLDIDLSGGQFAPGFTLEPTGKSEIEFAVTSPGDAAVRITGQPSGHPNTFTVGDNGMPGAQGQGAIDLNGDDDADVTFAAAPPHYYEVQVFGGVLPDTLSAAGGHGTGGPASAGTFIANGGSSGDTLIGGDSYHNGLYGTDGNDTLIAGSGSSIIGGQGGNDTIDATNGVADQINGGSGTDTATIDCGLDTVKNVENVACGTVQFEPLPSTRLGILSWPPPIESVSGEGGGAARVDVARPSDARR
jgi:hypothetical protein